MKGLRLGRKKPEPAETTKPSRLSRKKPEPAETTKPSRLSDRVVSETERVKRSPSLHRGRKPIPCSAVCSRSLLAP